MKNALIELLGWLGTATILLAFALNSFGVLRSHDAAYHLLNVFGAVGIILVSLKKKAYQPAALNAVWLLIAFAAVIAPVLKR